MSRSTSSRRSRACRAEMFALTVCAAFLSAFASAADAPASDLRSVVNDLRHGGYVTYMRHATTEQAAASETAVDLTRCETQRNLSADGRAQALRSVKRLKL